MKLLASSKIQVFKVHDELYGVRKLYGIRSDFRQRKTFCTVEIDCIQEHDEQQFFDY